MNKIKKISMKLSWYMNSKDIFEFSTFFSLEIIVLESQILSYETKGIIVSRRDFLEVKVLRA